MADWIEIGRIEDIPRQGARTVRTGEGDIAVFRTAQDKIHALKDECPHKGGPLSQGIVHGDRVTCPMHDWQIQLATGEAVAPDEGCARVYRVRVKEGRIFLMV
ncbi:MAG TPA: nitrite reductase small subunit NirD [Sedimenticola sp.]|nr:nitrite reductase small subunit NirD [Sedimenticola sp.]